MVCPVPCKECDIRNSGNQRERDRDRDREKYYTNYMDGDGYDKRIALAIAKLEKMMLVEKSFVQCCYYHLYKRSGSSGYIFGKVQF